MRLKLIAVVIIIGVALGATYSAIIDRQTFLRPHHTVVRIAPAN